MAVKKKNLKSLDKKTLLKRAVKIKCCYCLSKDSCMYKSRKMKSEESGCITYCTLSPNRPKKFLKKKSTKK